MKVQNVLWDFNGTILDDVQIGIDAVNVLLRRRNKPVLSSLDEYQAIFGFPIMDYYVRAVFDFREESFEKIAPEWVAEYLKREPSAPICPGVRETLRRFRNAGMRQYIVSASEIGILKKQITARGLADYFEGLFGLDNIHAGSKEAIVCEVVRSLNGSAVMLGDTVHDAECAAAAKIPVILIAAGHQSFQKLSDTGKPTVRSALEACQLILEEI